MQENEHHIETEQCRFCHEDIFWVESATKPGSWLPLSAVPPSEERARELGVYTLDGQFHRYPSASMVGWLFHPMVCTKREHIPLKPKRETRALEDIADDLEQLRRDLQAIIRSQERNLTQ